MSYFPNSLMPLTPKENVPSYDGTNDGARTLADDYNRNDQEIRAIEEFLGGAGSTRGLGLPSGELPELKIFQGRPNSVSDELVDPRDGDIFNVVSQMVDVVNNLTEFGGQASLSGYVHSGMRMSLPDSSYSTFLAVVPGRNDRTINVGSTAGFPERGVISILNDVQRISRSGSSAARSVPTGTGATATNVEWIRYSGREPTKFLNCERGFLNTTIGPHSGTSIQPPRDTSFNRNERDFCTFVDGVGAEICDREWPWWRERSRIRLPFFGVQGFRRDIINFLRRYGAKFPLNAGYIPAQSQQVISIASGQGILTTVSGTPFLQSGSQSLRQRGLLGYTESSQFLTALQDAGLTTEEEIPETAEIGLVPVFLGSLSIHHAVSAMTRATTLNIDAMQIVQTADARLFAFLADYANRDKTLQAIVNYHAYFASPAVTTSLRNTQ